MAKGLKTGGRSKGTPNKATLEVQERLEELGCDPIEGMARIGMEAEQRGEFQLAGQMYKELAQYVAPKRRATEISTNVTTTHEEWLELLEQEEHAETNMLSGT